MLADSNDRHQSQQFLLFLKNLAAWCVIDRVKNSTT